MIFREQIDAISAILISMPLIIWYRYVLIKITYRLKTTPKVLEMTPMVFFHPLMNWRRRVPRDVAGRPNSSSYELILPVVYASDKTLHYWQSLALVRKSRFTELHNNLFTGDVHRFKSPSWTDDLFASTSLQYRESLSELFYTSNLNIKSSAVTGDTINGRTLF